ncbi:MAG: hypothetical protein COY40_01165 [Alphaproteobacteria bacterium CG_4_10_14_0_8_um_filter_53_9]|nr:MAG: hypothetical protein COY40_01165 [Alphaproteobacteria bacterium CG_4_10_14_0_8_um_filter_53_9]
MSTLDLSIGNKAYRLAVPAGGEEKARSLARKIDTLMMEIRKADPAMDRDNLLMLAALQLASEAEGTEARSQATLDAVNLFHKTLSSRLESLAG